MNWLRKLFAGKLDDKSDQLEAIQTRFTHFLALLNQNNQVLKVMSDMEEKAQGDFLFDINYIRSSLSEVRAGVRTLVDEMIALGGDDYKTLLQSYRQIDESIEQILPGSRPLEVDELCIPFDQLRRERAFSVGSKSAQLGEMKGALGLPVPDGFAISGWAYKQFLDSNDLQSRIEQFIKSVDITGYAQLVEISERIQQTVKAAVVPAALAEAINRAADELTRRSGRDRFSLRSSAIGEDTMYSFAGQYATHLGVPASTLVDRYLDIIASKFTPQAIYYYLSHSLEESELAMSVGCVVMVDARSSGVIYTRDPVRPQDDCLLVNAAFGLGKFVVDGTVTPDVFRVSRQDGSVLESTIARKTQRLVLDAKKETRVEAIPESEQEQPSIDHVELKTLCEFALRIEQHYGCPQDIEWAIDRSGQPYILQTRPLRLIEPTVSQAEPDLSGLTRLTEGGSTVCPGAGCGPICHVSSPDDLPAVTEGAVVVTPNSFAGLITVMRKVHAIVTETGGSASHMATIAREYRIPTISGLRSAADLPVAKEVTVDATNCVIYDGCQQQLVEARQPEYDLFADSAIFTLLKNLLAIISPLNLIHPTDPDFVPEKCRTFHDITRFCHQRAMDEMFHGGLNVSHKEKISIRLKTRIPLQINVIYIDPDLDAYSRKKEVDENDIGCEAMNHYWRGVRHEGWPGMPAVDVKGFLSVLGTAATKSESDDFSETSFAIISKEYMILSIRMGYHFTTVEAMCMPGSDKNYARMQYKEGGASRDRRERRIKLIRDVLSRVGFEHHSSGDFLDTRIVDRSPDIIKERLFQLGRLTILTKQLDMALSNDSIAEWYTQDIMKKLGIATSGEDRT